MNNQSSFGRCRSAHNNDNLQRVLFVLLLFVGLVTSSLIHMLLHTETGNSFPSYGSLKKRH